MKRFEKYAKWVTAFVFCTAVIAVYKTFDSLKDITEYFSLVLKALSPFFLGFAVAYVINMPAVRIERYVAKIKNKWVFKHSFGISMFIVYIIAVLLIVIIIRAVMPAVYRNVLDLYINIPSYLAEAENFLKNTELFEKIGIHNTFSLSGQINGFFEEFDITKVNEYAQGVFDVTSNVIDVFIAVIISVYMLIEKKKILHLILRLARLFVRGKRYDYAVNLASDINRVFTNYIYSRLMCSMIMAVVCSVTLTVLDVKYAIILGVCIGAGDMIPYFGSIVTSIIATVVTFFTGGIWPFIWTGLSLFILQQIDGNILSPKIMGDTLDISPLLVIFAVVVGGALFGFAGMLFSVPVVTVAKRLISEFVINKEKALKVEEGRNVE